MFLTARVTSDSGQTLTEPAKTFDEDGGTIGRDPDSDWVIPDSSGFLSRLHARIFFNVGAFYIEDVSTNGVYRIDAAEHIRITHPTRLNDGDLLELGDFKVRVEISGTRDFAFNSTGDFSWGFSALTVDESLLAVGTIAISEARGVFPDGTQFSIPDDDDPPEPLRVPADTTTSTVYLATVDTESGTKKRLQLLIETECEDKGLRLGVARVKELREDNSVALDEEYIPTVINCQAAPALLGIAKEVLGLLHHRGESLAARMAAAAGTGPADIADFLMLQTINRYEPLLGHLLSLSVLHPEALYRLAIEIVGELSTFGAARKRPPRLPIYRHDSLQTTFCPVIQGLRKLLSMILEQAAVSLPIKPDKYGYFSAAVAKELVDVSQLVLAVKGQLPSAELLRGVPQSITIGPPAQITQLVSIRQPGIRIRALPAAPRQIPYHAGYVYFELALERQKEWIAAIKRSGALALHLGADFGDMDVQLWAIRSEQPEEPDWGDATRPPYHAAPLSDETLTPEFHAPMSSGQPEETEQSHQDESATATDWDKNPKSAPSVDEVQFTVYRPTAIKPLAWYTLLAFTHRSTLPADAAPDELPPSEAVERQANYILGSLAPQYQTLTQDGSYPVSRAMEITLVPEVPGVEFNPPRRSFLWEETVHREEFRLRADATMDGKVARGRITVFLGSIILADISLNIRVHEAASSRQESPELSTDRSNAYKKIFASYSHNDRGIVEQFVHYAKALGDEYLMDLTHLRAGEKWSEGLQQMIRDANIFQLFWSSDSMRSPFVRREWEYALSLHRPGFIRPTYWEKPLPCSPTEDLPPESLRQLHFQRISLKYLPKRGPMRVDSVTSAQRTRNEPIAYQGRENSKRVISPLIWVSLALMFAFLVWAIMEWW